MFLCLAPERNALMLSSEVEVSWVAGNGHIMNFLWGIIHLWNCMMTPGASQAFVVAQCDLYCWRVVGRLPLDGNAQLPETFKVSQRQIFPEQRETQSGRTKFMPILRDGYNPFFDSNQERSCLVEVKQLELHARRSPLHFRVQWLGMCSAVFFGGQNFTTWP
ncbi:unnamed protein product [Sphagnum troendelagicum]